MGGLIAGIMAVLGTLLVLGGGAVIVLRGLNAEPAAPGTLGRHDSTVEVGRSGLLKRWGTAAMTMPADRLIAWGIVLLVLAAVAAGQISFNLGAAAGTR